ncbi:MAG: ABC transporter permease [Candidatus Hodarchaeales archaeon]
MNIQRISSLVKKDLKKLVRVPTTLFMALLFPLVLTGAFGFAFGSLGGTAGEVTYTIGIVNMDGTSWADHFIGNLTESEVLKTKSYETSVEAEDDLSQGIIDAFLVIPEYFGSSFDSYNLNPANASTWHNSTVELYVDQGSMIVSAAIPPLIQQILVETLYGKQALNVAQPVQIGTPEGIEADYFTQFDLMAPGMFAFAAIFLTMIVAEGFVEERTEGILRRIQVTPTSPTDVILSSVTANMIIAALQVAIIFIVANLMGFSPLTDLSGYMFAFTIVLLLALCNIGFGLITASIAKTPGAATGISFMFILPQMFLGTFVPVPDAVGQLVPAYYVTDALTSILLRGAAITSQKVLIDLVIMISFSVVVIIAGIIVFAKFGRDK